MHSITLLQSQNSQFELFLLSKKIFNAHFKPQWRKSGKVSVIVLLSELALTTQSLAVVSSLPPFPPPPVSWSGTWNGGWRRRRRKWGRHSGWWSNWCPAEERGKGKSKGWFTYSNKHTRHMVSCSQLWKLMSWMDLLLMPSMLFLYIALAICGQQS